MATPKYRSTPSYGGTVPQLLLGPGIDEYEDADAREVFEHATIEEHDRILRLLNAAYDAGRRSMQVDLQQLIGLQR